MADLFHFVRKPYNVRNNLIIKGKQTAQFILEQKIYILLLQNYGNQFQAKLKAQNCQIFLKKKQNLGQQTNVLVGFVKRMLETLVSISGVLKDETLKPTFMSFYHHLYFAL